jgi:hypothetical protein
MTVGGFVRDPLPGLCILPGNDWQRSIIALDFIENQSLDLQTKIQENHMLRP